MQGYINYVDTAINAKPFIIQHVLLSYDDQSRLKLLFAPTIQPFMRLPTPDARSSSFARAFFGLQRKVMPSSCNLISAITTSPERQRLCRMCKRIVNGHITEFETTNKRCS
jgi:hypothetical protein